VEEMTNRIEQGAQALLARIDAAGGTLSAIEQGLIQREIQESAYREQQKIDSHDTVVVGVNRFATDESAPVDVLRIDLQVEQRQVDRVRAVRGSRDQAACTAALARVTQAAKGSENLVPNVIHAVEARATLGEIADAMRIVFGEHKELDV
jgi:methylmalonyl-CoA mutase, N-terminal domain